MRRATRWPRGARRCPDASRENRERGGNGEPTKRDPRERQRAHPQRQREGADEIAAAYDPGELARRRRRAPAGYRGHDGDAGDPGQEQSDR
jgi:hypothetical protein